MAIRSSNQVAFSEYKKITTIEEWYLATSQSSGVTTSTSGWTKTVQHISKDKKYLWNYEKTIYSIGDPDVSEPVIIGMYSEASGGRSIEDVVEYYAVTTTTDAPSESAWKSTVPELTPENKYLWNYEVIVYSDGSQTKMQAAIIGVYGDSGVDAITFEIYSTDGFIFREDTQSITLDIAAFDGVTEISNATYQWYWWDKSFGPNGGYRNIGSESSEKKLTVYSTDDYANTTLKCTMEYNNQVFNDYVSLSEETIIYTPMIKFFEGSNILHAEDKYIVAYLELFRNNNLIESVKTQSYCTGISKLNSDTGVITPNAVIKDDEVQENDLMYFIVKDDMTVTEAQRKYNQVVREANVIGYTDHDKTVFGNIDMNNRQIIAWDETKYNQNKTALDSLGWTFEELDGTISNVMGMYETYNDVNIAYSPMLQTNSGVPKILTIDEINTYIWGLLNRLPSSWNTENLLSLDRQGATVSGTLIKNIIADAGNEAVLVAEQMHYAGNDGAIAQAKRTLDAAKAFYVYDAILGKYINGQWIKQEIVNNYEYKNTLYSEDNDNIIVISKESINKSQNIVFTVYKDGEQLCSTNINIIDSNDPIISDTPPVNPVFSQLWLDTSSEPYVLKIYTQIDDSDAGEWVVCSDKIGGSIFTSKPASYKKGDLWILADGESCGDDYGPGSMLKAIATSSVFREEHWIDADSDGSELKKNINSYFRFSASEGLTIGEQDGNEYYVNINPKQMTFVDNTNNQQKPVVWISNKEAHIEQLEVVNQATFNNNVYFQDEIHLFGKLVFKQESDGSMSLAVN